MNEACLDSGPATGAAGYHGVAAVFSDNNSIGSIVNSITQIRCKWQTMPTYELSMTTSPA